MSQPETDASSSPRPARTFDRRASAAGIAAVTSIGGLVAWAGSDGGASLGGLKVFVLVAMACFAVNWVAFVPSFIARTEHYYDLTGSVTYLSVMFVALLASDEIDGRSVILFSLVLIWALRLGSFLFLRVRAAGEDRRFRSVKHDFARFLMWWSIQGLWVLLTAACALAAITASDRTPLSWVAVVGLVLWVVGFSIEVVADGQKSAFKNDSANDGRFIAKGIWAWSRHPNYFGEITLWLGVALIAVRGLSGWQHVTLISPVFVFLLLTRVSGVPALEARADRKWGHESAYQQYKQQTPVLIPRPPR